MIGQLIPHFLAFETEQAGCHLLSSNILVLFGWTHFVEKRCFGFSLFHVYLNFAKIVCLQVMLRYAKANAKIAKKSSTTNLR